VSLFLSAVLVATALRGTLDLSNRAQVGTRAGGILAGPTLDLETGPEVKLGVRSRLWEFSADYSPRFTGSVAGADPQSYVLQQGRIGARYQDRRTSISLYEDTGYGRLSLLTLGTYAGATLGTTPLTAPEATEIIDYAWSRTGIVARLAATRRWSLTFTGELALSGGTGALAQVSMPFQTALRAGVGGDYAASRRDHLTTTLDAARAVFSTGLEDTLLEGKVSWRHDLDAGLATTLAAGMGWSSTRADTGPAARTRAAPIAEAGLTYRPRASTIELGLTLRLAPVIDAFSGRVDQRVDGTGSVTWEPTRNLTVQGQLGAARSIPWAEGVPLSMGFGAVTVTYRINDVVQVDGGGRSAWIRTEGMDAPAQWIAFAGLTFRVPTIRF
jgi:hypothetical protein